MLCTRYSQISTSFIAPASLQFKRRVGRERRGFGGSDREPWKCTRLVPSTRRHCGMQLFLLTT